MSRLWKKYLLWFAQEHVEFRLAEIDSLLSLYSIEMKHSSDRDVNAPFWIVEFLRESDAKRLASRSVSVKSCIELWAHSNSVESLHHKLKAYPKALMEPYCQPQQSFKIEVETFCRHFSQQEKVEKIETFSYLPVQGSVKLSNPDVCFQYFEYYGTVANNPPLVPYEVFFGRLISSGLRQLIQKLSLKTRKFIGNTTMDPQLSLLMANQAKVNNGDTVLDPFVGSGSLLVAAAEFGGYVIGGDIDYMMLHAKTRPTRIKQKKRAADESIKENMKQYKLEDKYLDVLINDFTTSFWRDGIEFDSIITDPPYGIRESTERVGTNRENYAVSDEHLPTHIPSKIEYGISRIYNDLLIFAAKHLRLGGRLVCWFPIFREDYQEEGLPRHPCFQLMANCEQILTKITSRRLLTFEKIRQPTTTDINVNDHPVIDFREKYYEAREETRKERRTREAQIRNENWLEAIKNKHS